MNAKEIIALNNEKREQLNEDNLIYYEDMLMYIRLSSTKSEQQTEEILLELLEHTLEAQHEGKTVKDIFGDDLKAYCQDLIEEIPRETKKKQFKFAFMIILQFLAIISFFNGIIGFGLYYFFAIGEKTTTFYLGSSIAITIIDLVILFLVIAAVLKWIKSSVFREKQKKKWVEFLQLWFFSTLVIGLFFCIIYFMPEFGPPFNLPTITFAGIGIALYGLSYLFKDRN